MPSACGLMKANSERPCVMVLHSEAADFINMCPAAFRWLQRFNEWKEKLFIQFESLIDNRDCRITHINL